MCQSIVGAPGPRWWGHVWCWELISCKVILEKEKQWLYRGLISHSGGVYILWKPYTVKWKSSPLLIYCRPSEVKLHTCACIIVLLTVTGWVFFRRIVTVVGRGNLVTPNSCFLRKCKKKRTCLSNIVWFSHKLLLIPFIGSMFIKPTDHFHFKLLLK